MTAFVKATDRRTFGRYAGTWEGCEVWVSLEGKECAGLTDLTIYAIEAQVERRACVYITEEGLAAVQRDVRQSGGTVFARPRKAHSPKPRPVQCPACGAPYQADDDACQYCDTLREGR